jgi:hypothetical protein
MPFMLTHLIKWIHVTTSSGTHNPNPTKIKTWVNWVSTAFWQYIYIYIYIYIKQIHHAIFGLSEVHASRAAQSCILFLVFY